MAQEEAPFRPWATWAIVAGNLIVLLSMASSGISTSLIEADHLVAFGGLSAVKVWQGEIWRIATALFVHGAWWHFAFNMIVFWQVGRLLERVLGTGRLFLLYFISGLFGFALSLILQPGLTVGASGAIFGVVGGLLGYATLTRGQQISQLLFSSLKPFVLATLLIGFWIPFIDSSAHIGGLVMGYLLCVVLLFDESIPTIILEDDSPVRVRTLKSAQPGRFSGAALIVVFAFFALILALSVRPTFSPRFATTMAWEKLSQNQPEAAAEYSRQAAKLAPEDTSVLLLRGRIAMNQEALGSKEGPSHPIASPESRRYFEIVFDRLGDQTADQAIQEALQLFVPPHASDPMFFDEATTLGLCTAALDTRTRRVNALARNNCGWFFLKAKSRRIANKKKGLALAQAAYSSFFPEGIDVQNLEKSDQRVAAAILHTLAEAHAQNGNAAEAQLYVQRIIAQGLSSDRFFEEEADRFGRLALRQENQIPLKPPPLSTKPNTAPVTTPLAKPVTGVQDAGVKEDSGTSSLSNKKETSIGADKNILTE
jgi:membrane associated rhomboid family serine protease